MSTAANPKASQTHPSDAPQESTGAVTSDSLAAESIKADGGFAENQNAAISSVKGSNSTFNTTDTSGASVLQPAADGSAREKQEAKGLGSDEKGVSGVKYPEAAGSAQFDGVHSTQGYVGGPSGSGNGSGSGSGSGSGTGGGSGSTDVKSAFGGASGDSFADGAGPTSSGESGGPVKGVSSGSEAAKKATASASSSSGTSGTSGQTSGSTSGTSGTSGSGVGSGSGSTSKATATDAPNYAATVSGALRPEGEDKPKGKNLTEGGIPETKTFTGDVGGQHDPGRVAEQEFQTVTAGNAASAAEKQHEGGAGQITGGKFDVLESERA